MLTETKITPEFILEMNEYRAPDKTKGLVEACSGNVVLFSERMLGIKLYSWQVRFLTRLQEVMNEPDPSVRAVMTKKFLALTSRQIGKSTSTAIFTLWATMFNKYPGTVHNNTIVGIVSATDVQAKKLLYEIRKILRTGDRYMENTYQEGTTPVFGKKFFSNLLDEGEANNTTTITFKTYRKDLHGPYLLFGSKSGSVIKSYPPTSIVLGETFTVLIVDEAGKSDKISDQFFFDFAMPTVSSTDGMVILLSTPWVTSGFFYMAADPDDNGTGRDFERFMFTCEAVKDENKKQYDVIQKEIAELHNSGMADVVQRAYYCRFVKGETSYFDPQSVMEVFTKDYSMLGSYSGVCDMGVDFGGQVTSKTVVTITELRDDGIIRRLFHRVYPVGQDLSLLDDIGGWLKDFNVQRIIPDDCPAGDFLIRTMKEKGWNVLPMNFRTDKVKKYGAFRSMVNKSKVISYDDDALKTEMLAMEFSQGSKQSVIQHAPGYTDDLIDSFVMSSYFFVQEDGGVKTFEWNSETPEEKAIREGKVANDKVSILQRLRDKKVQHDW
jgi:hypothetical protein